MIIARNLLLEMAVFLKRREYLAIVGPRQAGKSTFLEIIQKYLIEELGVKQEAISMVTFEDRKLLRQFEDDPLEFARSYMGSDKNQISYLMLDEFQYAEEGGQKLKLIYDSYKNIKIIVTGSSSLEIKAQLGKYLVGRILTFYLYPFNFEEFLRAQNRRLEKIYQGKNKIILSWLFKRQKSHVKQGADPFLNEMIDFYEAYCTWGGYPAVVLSRTNTERLKVLADIYNNYILKDIKGLLELATEKNLFLLSQYLATQIGNITVYQNMGQAASLDWRQLKKHLNILKETFILDWLSPYFSNRQKELTKNPKIYFCDLGFRNYLVENTSGLEKRSDSGAIVENQVFIRAKEISALENKINFWRTKAGAEVDFIFKIRGEIIPIEVKFSEFTGPKITRSLASFLESFRPKKALVLTKNYWGSVKKGPTQILFAPVYYL